MSAQRKFLAALSRLDDASDPVLLPTRVAAAVAHALPVAGASISIKEQGLRVPLGASDDASAIAERLQFTIGDGPCMQAIDKRVVVSMSESLLRRRFPALAEVWRRETPFRSVVSQPLQPYDGIDAALNLFFLRPEGGRDLDPGDLAAVAAAASAALFRNSERITVPSTGGAGRRLQVWVGIGVVMSAQHLVAEDALDRLRARAFVLGRTVDELTAQLIDRPDTVSDFDD